MGVLACVSLGCNGRMKTNVPIYDKMAHRVMSPGLREGHEMTMEGQSASQ